ncbi:MAG: baseplate J/gp47 family protein [Anaerolineae bacterium]
MDVPEDESTFFVDYFRQDSRSPLSDINVGSVTRTLGEAIGREIATVYQQINQAYLAGFVDTATGKSLDLVVSILGIKRQTKDFAVGRVTFFRDTAVTGNITIPEGVLLATSKGEATFQTTQLRTLQQGQVRIDVPIRATDEFKGDAGKVDGGAITEISRPIAGISRITNFDATFLGADDESDEELRARAKAVLRALGKATLAALSRVIFEERATLVETWDPNGPPAKRPDLGEVVLLVETEPERFESLNAAVQETRAAGIQATVVARYIFFKPRVVVTINPGITGPGKEKIVNQVIASLQAYVDGLSSGDPAEGEKLLKAIRDADKDNIREARIVDVITWRSDIGEPGAETLVNEILAALATSTPGDQAAQKEAITKIVTEETPTLLPSGSRIPDRSLVVGESGDRATDEEIESGKFKVVAEYEGEKWWVVLEMEAADIFLEEAS